MLKIFLQAYYMRIKIHLISFFLLESPVDADGRDKVGLCHRDNKAESEDICVSKTSKIFFFLLLMQFIFDYNIIFSELIVLLYTYNRELTADLIFYLNKYCTIELEYSAFLSTDIDYST